MVGVEAIVEVEEATTLVTHRQTQADMKIGGMVTTNWLLGGEVGVVLGVEAKEEAEKVEVEDPAEADGLEMGWLLLVAVVGSQTRGLQMDVL